MVVSDTSSIPLPLHPGDYPGTYKQVGGRISFDFVNTISYPLAERRHDWLDRVDNFLIWAQASDLIGDEDRSRWKRRIRAKPVEGKRALARIRSCRAIIAAVLSPLAHRFPMAPRDVEAFNTLLLAATKHRRVDPTDLAWAWDEPRTLDHVVRPVVWDAAVVLTDTDHERIGYCPGCDWLFYDTTRNHSRRWCDMADCGSRDKSLRYYHRQRERL